jgi:RNA polymerase sigma factor (sigma-70 family)
MKTNFSDKEIVDAIKVGKANDVLRFLYSTTQMKIRSWILKNNGNEEEVQDIFQDAVIAFYDFVLAGKFSEGKSVDAFIFSIGRNLWINRVNQKNKIVGGSEVIEKLGEVSEDDNYIQSQEKVERAEKLEGYLNQLGERCRELLTLSIFNKMRMDDISLQMGFSNANAAKTKNYKCKQRLMKIMKADKNLNDWMYK